MKQSWLVASIIATGLLSGCISMNEGTQHTPTPSQPTAQKAFTPAQFGQDAFDALQHVDRMDQYLTKTISHAEFKHFVEHHPTMGQRAKQDFNRDTPQKFRMRKVHYAEQIRDAMQKAKVDVTALRFVDFKSNIQNRDGVKMLSGVLLLSANNRPYQVQVRGVWVTDEFRLLILRNFQSR